MKTTCILLLTLFIVSTMSFRVSAQPNLWSANDESRGSIPTAKGVARQSFPTEFKLFNLNIEPLRQQLFSIVDGNPLQQSTVISLPNADGSIEQFEVFEASNFEPDLQAQFPEIRAYSGRGITDMYATLKLSISPQGIQTMVFRTDKENEFIEPYSEDHTVYAVFRSQRKPAELPWTCFTEPEINSQPPQPNAPVSNTGQLKTMRLAQSCNGEYANYFGATSSAQVALVLAAFNATLTRCNGVYERDLALHLNLIASTTSVIYYNPATDPYTSLGAWNGQLQSTLTSIIGEANYDIGHMFGASGGGGNAGCIGCVCDDGIKGSGITSPADGIPEGDNFDIDYVVHEVGHQLGANHTFSHSASEGEGQHKEVGSGITIMGYAGITSRDVAPHSIDIFHETSIAQIQANLAPKTCPVTTNITANNATPIVSPVSNYTIPISTPFALTGSATDANPGDALTYCWEQNDATTSLTGANSVASPTKATGPNWLSFSPTASPTRLFPKLSTIQAGLLVTPVLPGGDAGTNIEALSSVSRTLNFRLTVRDNSPYSSTAPIKVGQTQFTDMTVTVTNTSGPFSVTSPNTNVSWAGGSVQTITWNVANTNTGAVSCANVKISLSTDGGTTFPTVILASTPNDGSQAVTIPVGATTTARMKVEAVGNIFFDISNTNFTITAPVLAAPTTVFPSDNAMQQPVSLTIRWNTVATATTYRLQVGTDSTFVGGLIVNDSTLTDTLLLVSGMNFNTKYFWRVNAKSGATTSPYSSLRRFTTLAPPAAATLVSPADNVTGEDTSLTVRWSTTATATSYGLQVSSDSTFGGGFIVNDSTLVDTSYVVGGLSFDTRYFWRVNGKNIAGTGVWSSIRRFTTLAPPAAPSLVSPAENAVNQSLSLPLVWHIAPTASGYVLEVSTDSTFAGGQVLLDSTLVDTTRMLSGLVSSTQHFWRVKGNNAAGTGAWSSLGRFTTLAPPVAPSLVSPSDSVVDQSLSLTLVWNVTPVTIGYILEVSTDSAFAGGQVLLDSTLVDTTRLLNGLAGSTQHFWRVKGHNEAGIGSWSNVRRFTTIAPPPATILVSPADSSIDQSPSLVLVWNAVATAAEYFLQLSTDSTFSGGLIVNDSTLTDTAYFANGLSANTEYHWRVRTSNEAGNGGWSPQWRFTTIPAPATVVLLAPLNDAEIPVDSVEVVWEQSAPNVTSYWLEWSTDSLFVASSIDSTVADTVSFISDLQDNTMYYWRVRASNEAGWGTFSEVRRFNTLFQVQVCIPLQSSWNLVSLPVGLANDSSHVVFPACGPTCPFEYISGSGYQESCIVEKGKGYWVKCTSGATCVTGVAIERDTIEVLQGWNIIGTISTPVAVSSIVTDPPGILQSPFYTFSNGYESTDTLLPGSAYWVKVTQAGTVILDSGTAPATVVTGTPLKR